MEVSPDSSSPQSLSNWKQYHHTTLPTDIIIEVLLKLPVESLLRCKFVCKSWFSLISEPRFVKSHLNLSAHNKRMIYTIGWSSVLNTCCLKDVMAGNFINNDLQVVDYPLKSVTESVRVVGSCNGLLCLDTWNDHDILFIWNPSIKNYHKLPSDAYRTSYSPVHFGFGYDEFNDDYKVVSISSKRRNTYMCDFDTFVKTYSLRNGGWKDIGAFPFREPVALFGTFLNGALHWLALDNDGCCVIVSLDLATETFGEVMQPLYDEGKKELFLGSLGERLFVLCDYYDGHVDLWVMKVYGVKDSWTKLVSFPYLPEPEIKLFLVPLCISNDGKVLLTLGPKLMIYDSKISSFLDVKNFDKYISASTFVESLVSPMPPTTALGHRLQMQHQN